MNESKGRPGLIVFDLDCTLWPFHVDSTVNPPFSKKGTRIVDKYNEDIRCYPEVPEVLEFLKGEGYLLAAASRTTKPESAKQLLDLLGWNQYFNFKEIYPGCKVTHFQAFYEATKIPYSSMLFFDDEMRNIKDMEKVGVKCILVINGVNMKLIKDSLEQFQCKCT